jgi:hypothetical protein
MPRRSQNSRLSSSMRRNVRNDSPDLFSHRTENNRPFTGLLLVDGRAAGINPSAIKYSSRLGPSIVVVSYIDVARLPGDLYRLAPAGCRVSTVPNITAGGKRRETRERNGRNSSSVATPGRSGTSRHLLQFLVSNNIGARSSKGPEDGAGRKNCGLPPAISASS